MKLLFIWEKFVIKLMGAGWIKKVIGEAAISNKLSNERGGHTEALEVLRAQRPYPYA